jgi:hypothetical protein
MSSISNIRGSKESVVSINADPELSSFDDTNDLALSPEHKAPSTKQNLQPPRASSTRRSSDARRNSDTVDYLENLPEKEDRPVKPKSQSLFAPTGSQRAVMRRLTPLNEHGRLDFVLQGSILENQYLSSLGVHMNYWSDVDCNALIVRSLYRIKLNPN